MFVDEKQQGEPQTAEQANRKLKLSEAIRIGKPLISGENKFSYKLCGLGCAWAGVRGHEMSDEDGRELIDFARAHHLPIAQAIGAFLGFDPEAAQRVNDLHICGRPALEIADLLEAQGL